MRPAHRMSQHPKWVRVQHSANFSYLSQVYILLPLLQLKFGLGVLVVSLQKFNDDVGIVDSEELIGLTDRMLSVIIGLTHRRWFG